MKPPSEAPSIPRASRAQGHSRPSSKPLLDCAANTRCEWGVGNYALPGAVSDDSNSPRNMDLNLCSTEVSVVGTYLDDRYEAVENIKINSLSKSPPLHFITMVFFASLWGI